MKDGEMPSAESDHLNSGQSTKEYAEPESSEEMESAVARHQAPQQQQPQQQQPQQQQHPSLGAIQPAVASGRSGISQEDITNALIYPAGAAAHGSNQRNYRASELNSAALALLLSDLPRNALLNRSDMATNYNSPNLGNSDIINLLASHQGAFLTPSARAASNLALTMQQPRTDVASLVAGLNQTAFSTLDQTARIAALLQQNQRIQAQQQLSSSLAGIWQLSNAGLLNLAAQPTLSHQVQAAQAVAIRPGHLPETGSSGRASLPVENSCTSGVTSSLETIESPASQVGDFPPAGHPPIPLAADADSANLVPYQCLLRQQIELFETREEDVGAKAQGRNIPIRVGQVGIRCRHCASLPRSKKAEGGAVFYSKTIKGIYQVSLNMGRIHSSRNCTMIPGNVKKSLVELKKLPRRVVRGRQYWKETLEAQGVVEEQGILRFKPL